MRRTLLRLAIAALALACLTVSLLSYRQELAFREAVESAIARYGLEARRPDGVRTLRFQPAADLRATFFADMTLDDVYSPVALGRLTAAERALWLQSLVTLDEQLESARALTLDALKLRPGRAYHNSYLGELEYAILRRRSLGQAAGGIRRWERPILNGIAAAPGDLTLPMRLAGAYIETWGAIEPEGDARDVMRRAMRVDAFVSRNYRLVGLIFGSDDAIALLPDKPSTLRIAFERERKDRRVPEAATLRSRIDASERAARAEGLAEIRERARLGDVWGQTSLVRQWVGRFRPESIDDDAGRAEVAEVLSLWPDSSRGSWVRDPRAEIVRYFLAGRERDVPGETLASTISMLADVPGPVEARVLALAGHGWESSQLIRSSNTTGSFEWTPAIVALARLQHEKGDSDAAAGTLSLLAPAARSECNVLLLRRDLGDEAAAALLSEETRHAGSTGNGEGVSLCVDPKLHADKRLIVTVTSPEPSLVSWGWDSGRLGSRLTEGGSEIAVPLSGLTGRHPFRVETEAGPEATISNVRIE